MGSRKPARPKGDHHTTSTLVRIDKEIYAAMAALAAENHRPLKWEVDLALANHLAANGKRPASGR